MKFIASLAVAVALLAPVAPASAMTLSESITVLQTIQAEVELAAAKLAYLTGNSTTYVAGATTDTGLEVFVNGERTLQVSTATNRAVASDICYVFATEHLIAGDEYTCEFNGALIFDSETDAI